MKTFTNNELKRMYQILSAYNEGLIENPSEDWEMDHYDAPIADKTGLYRILKKIETLLPKEDADECKKAILRRRYDSFNNEIDETVYRKIETAFEKTTTVEIGYFDIGSAEIKKREIDVYYKSRKYVVAYCHLRNAMRKFRTSRIVSAKLTNKKYNIPQNFEKNDYL